jgi:hypothetical protein
LVTAERLAGGSAAASLRLPNEIFLPQKKKAAPKDGL